MTDSSTDGSMDLYSDDEEELSALERVSTDLPLPGGKEVDRLEQQQWKCSSQMVLKEATRLFL